MPKAGFRSITVADCVYNKFYDTYKAKKKELRPLGVKSFAGYITHLVELKIREDEIFTQYNARFEKILIEKTRVVLKDNKLDRIIEIVRDAKNMCCLHCDKPRQCMHVGFCYSLYELYPLNNN